MSHAILEAPRTMRPLPGLVPADAPPEGGTFYVVTAALTVLMLVLTVVCVWGALYVVMQN